MPEEWAMSESETGWMNGENYFEFIANYFVKFVKEQGVTFPVEILLDGHKSYLTFHLSKFCSENRIVLIALPPNCTHLIQPEDVAIFGPVKKEWASCCPQVAYHKRPRATNKIQLPSTVERSVRQKTKN